MKLDPGEFPGGVAAMAAAVVCVVGRISVSQPLAAPRSRAAGSPYLACLAPWGRWLLIAPQVPQVRLPGVPGTLGTVATNSGDLWGTQL